MRARAVADLVNASNSLIVAVARTAAATDDGAGRAAVKEAQYKAQGLELADSDFCLCPAGDSSVTSRFYSSIAAGCIPVVVAPGFSGAFASHVPYESVLLRVSAAAFLRSPQSLLSRLEAIPQHGPWSHAVRPQSAVCWSLLVAPGPWPST